MDQNLKNKSNPLQKLIGKWEGSKGLDMSPKPEIDEENEYQEILIIEPIDMEIENAGEQELRTVRYFQYVKEIETGDVSHSETGFWIWDINSDEIVCAFSTPRGISLLAHGNFKINEDNDLVIEIESSLDDPNWTIVQKPFMEQKAKTMRFARKLKVSNDTLEYSQETRLYIYDKHFDHKDTNTLKKVE